jgi:hypothetical protein
MGGIKPKSANVLADYESDPPVVDSWNDEPLDSGWIEAYERYLKKQRAGPAAWEKVKCEGGVRSLLEVIHALTTQQSPERQRGSGWALEDKRQLYSKLKENFRKSAGLLRKIGDLTSYRHSNVADDHTDPMDWPPGRDQFAEWLITGKELMKKLESHFKSISHASREEKNDIRFLNIVFRLRQTCRCSNPEIAALIGSGMAASGSTRSAIEFGESKLKDDLRRLKKRLPDQYKEIEIRYGGVSTVM